KAVQDLDFAAVVPAYFHIVPLGEVVGNGKDHRSLAAVHHRLLGHHDGIALRGMDHRPGVHAGKEPAGTGELEGDLHEAVLVDFGINGGNCSGYRPAVAGYGMNLRLLSEGNKADI